MAKPPYLGPNTFLYIWQKIKNGYVAKDGSKGLSTNDYTTEEKNKLSGIDPNANNYTLPAATKDKLGGVKVGDGLAINEGVLSATDGGVADSVDYSGIINNKAVEFQSQTLTDEQKTQARTNIDAAKLLHQHTLDDITETTGKKIMTADERTKLSGVDENANNYSLPAAKADTLGGVKIGSGISVSDDGTISTTSLDWNNISSKPLGTANGVATLDSNGVVPSNQLPSYVDDVVEGYYDGGEAGTKNFYSDPDKMDDTTLITGEPGKIYLDLFTNLSYRFGGTAYTLITSSDMVEMTNEQIDAIIASIA